MNMPEIILRDLRSEDYPVLSKMIDDEWSFHLYSKVSAEDLARYYLLHCADGANVAKTLLVDGVPAGVLVIGDMDGPTVDYSEDLAECKRSLMELENFAQCEKDLEELHRVYRSFASKNMKPEWAELRLLIISDQYKGLGLGRRMIEEARKHVSEGGKSGLFFYTDTDCNFGFYDHMGAVRVGEEDIICTGEPLKVFCYYLEF